MKIGNTILLKYGASLVKAVVIDIDLTYFTIQFKYGRSEGTTLKVRKDSKDIININGISLDLFTHRNII